MRLTDKDDNFSYNIDTDISSESTGGYDIHGGVHISDIINKVGQVDDLEEEIGVDLKTFVNIVFAVEQECFVKNLDEIERAEIIGFTKDGGNYYVDLHIFSNTVDDDGMPSRYWYRNYNFKDYGKTWALTEKELS